MGESGRWPKRTIKLSIANPQGRGTIEINSIKVVDKNTPSLNRLKNGTFDQQLTYWLPSTDRDLAWHIHQTLLEVYFAQGLLGLIASLALLLAAAHILTPKLRQGDPFAIALAGGLLGFITIGLLSSTMDNARLSFLFYLVIFSGSLITTRQQSKK